MPIVGFGVFRVPEGEETVHSVGWALEAGYRLIDTAVMYENEEGTGKAIKDSGIPREEIFLQTKLANIDHGYENTLKAIGVSLEKLGVSYVDLYLIHWPTADPQRKLSVNKREETWRAMEEIYKSGRAKGIGVTNYTMIHLDEMKKYAKIPPAINQVEFHPFLYQKELLQYCKENNIVLEAHSPLVSGQHFGDETISTISKKYGKTNAQVLLRWSIQHGLVPIAKSVHKERIEENTHIFDFELKGEDMNLLDGLHVNLHVRTDPTNLK